MIFDVSSAPGSPFTPMSFSYLMLAPLAPAFSKRLAAQRCSDKYLANCSYKLFCCSALERSFHFGSGRRCDYYTLGGCARGLAASSFERSVHSIITVPARLSYGPLGEILDD